MHSALPDSLKYISLEDTEVIPESIVKVWEDGYFVGAYHQPAGFILGQYLKDRFTNYFIKPKTEDGKITFELFKIQDGKIGDRKFIFMQVPISPLKPINYCKF
jgi:hypothetical protein